MFDAHKLIKVPMITAKLNYWASGSSNQKQLKRFPRLSAVALHTNNILCHFLVIKAAISTMADTNQSLVMLMPIQINISNSSNMPEHYAMNQHARVIGSAVTCLNKKLLFMDSSSSTPSIYDDPTEWLPCVLYCRRGNWRTFHWSES